MENRKLLIYLRIVLGVTFIITISNAILLLLLADENNFLFISRSITAIIGFCIILAVLEFMVFALTWTKFHERLFQWLKIGYHLFQRGKLLNLIGYVILMISSPYLMRGMFWRDFVNVVPPHKLLDFFEGYFSHIIFRATILWVVLIFGGLLLDAAISREKRKLEWSKLFAAHWLIIGLIHEVLLFISEVSSYPFSLRWSEGSRLYYAWLFYQRDFWETKLELPLIDISQHILLGLPNIVSGLPIWAHRLWHMFLWIGISLWCMLLLARRLKTTGALEKFILVSWAFLFIYQGPVLYNLVLIVVLMLWGYDNNNFRKTTIIVLIASIWAGISRVNWIPMPGTLAATLYFLETPIGNNKVSIWKYLQRPIFWFFSGITLGFIALTSYFFLAGFEGSFFSYLPDQQLLWYRLLPNSTYRPGNILGILIISLPLIILIIKASQNWKSRWHTVRLLGLGSLVFVFFAGGLVASTKIGSSANIHHLDGFIILLLIIASYLYSGGFITEKGESWRIVPSRNLAVFILCIPVIYVMSSNWNVRTVNLERGAEDLNNIQVMVQEVVDQGEDVLFIAERHLLAFGFIQNVPSILEYEKVMLMEMAMSNDDAYIKSFLSDIRELSYGMLVTDGLSRVRAKNEGEIGLAEENNVWFFLIAQPVLCYYEPILTLSDANVELLVPREQPVC